MIPVLNPIDEPDDFDTRCRQRGATWLAGHPGSQKFPAYWQEFQPALEDGFSRRCGWLGVRITFGAVDHFISKNHRRDLAYEWSNYRYIAGTINSSKGIHDDALLDPFEVQSGWFEVILPSCQLKTTGALPSHLQAKADFTLKQLKLVNGPKVRKLRKGYYDEYKSGHLTKAGLREYAPLIADAVDQWEATGRRLL
jgi:hypothetical protein